MAKEERRDLECNEKRRKKSCCSAATVVARRCGAHEEERARVARKRNSCSSEEGQNSGEVCADSLSKRRPKPEPPGAQQEGGEVNHRHPTKISVFVLAQSPPKFVAALECESANASEQIWVL
eukprot:1082107-Rhodomonas_salina.1